MSRTTAMRDAPSLVAVGVLTGQHHLVGQALHGLSYHERMDAILTAQVQVSQLAKSDHVKYSCVDYEVRIAEQKLKYIYQNEEKKGGKGGKSP